MTIAMKLKQEGKIEDAINMIKDGLSIDKIIKYTGLPESELEKLLKNNQQDNKSI